MKYVPPLGAAADAPYIDANPAAGIEGSVVPAAALEHPQREIVALLEEAGLVPDTADLQQLKAAVLALIAAKAVAKSGDAMTGALQALALTSRADAAGTNPKLLLESEAAASLARLEVARAQGNRLVLARRAGGVDAGLLEILGAGDLRLEGLPVYHAGLGALGGFRNKLINGGFDVWQRGTSLVPGTGNSYLADRWMYTASPGGGTLGNATYTLQDFTLGQADVPGEPQHFVRVGGNITGGASGYVALRQAIEGVRRLAGKTVTLSFFARASQARQLGLSLAQAFGGGGSPSATLFHNAGNVDLTTSWQKFIATFTLNGLAGKTIGTDGTDALYVTFILDQEPGGGAVYNLVAGSANTVDIAQVQLEEGPAATPFEDRQPAVEMMLCLRYFQRLQFHFGFIATTSGQGAAGTLSFAPMRTVPVLTKKNLTLANSTDQSTTVKEPLIRNTIHSISNGQFSIFYDAELDAEI